MNFTHDSAPDAVDPASDATKPKKGKGTARRRMGGSAEIGGGAVDMAGGSRGRTGRATGRRTGSARKRLSPKQRQELAALNAHPLNQHALRLLPRWQLAPDEDQLHLLTLVDGGRFATAKEMEMLAKMHDEWPASEVMDYFAHVAAFEELFLGEVKPLEAVHVVLAAVDLVAEPQASLPAFRLDAV